MSAIPANFNGFIAIVKRDCKTCQLIAPVLRQLAATGDCLVYSQDDPAFPPGIPSIRDDRELEASYRLDIEIVPTIIRAVDGVESQRLVGWQREEWRALTHQPGLGAGLAAFSPGCGSKSVEPGLPEKLAYKFGDTRLGARRIEVAPLQDEHELAFERGWSDGLPIVPPTEDRVLRMLAGTTRAPDEIVGVIPPDFAPCSVEKVAINAVMAGCKPAYLPVALAAVEASCRDEFCMHGLLATTYFAAPIIIVNGTIACEIGMNSAHNVLGQGNRANATIGRALQLVIRNVGGGRPGGVDRSTLGQPGKIGFCFAEREHDSHWEPLSVERGFAPGQSTVTLFAGGGVHVLGDQKSRQPESLARSLAAMLRGLHHPKLYGGPDALLVISPEHMRVFREARWSKARFRKALAQELLVDAARILAGKNGIAEGMPERAAGAPAAKFREGGLQIVHAGGGAGMWSAAILGWAASGAKGSVPVTVPVTA
ncbi:MAG: thioredoxin family protein [Chloroflexi bacterium]|nr:thioredoxin family protein [Chloroflexota bacterium]MCY4246571.1 thioredoxin family protein [Chloroflexota bacterium]